MTDTNTTCSTPPSSPEEVRFSVRHEQQPLTKLQGEIDSQQPLLLGVADEKLRGIMNSDKPHITGHFHSLIEGYQQEISGLRDQINQLEENLRTVQNLLAAQEELNDIYVRRGEAFLTSPCATTPVSHADVVEAPDSLTYHSIDELDISSSEWDKWCEEGTDLGSYWLGPAVDSEKNTGDHVSITEGVKDAPKTAQVAKTADREKTSG